mmetsp:Transcript_3533/g.5506  ORF Transcript_3533/g.5506 Transcript_3533/m.5506 type:complete len:693 (-) Transcript_3533:341-2419(-)
MTLNSVKSLDIKSIADTIIIVCSTTGNGDAPENADSFWRKVKRRTTPKDAFCGIKYCVLALGDTNYDKFCYMGKAIDKRFSELGAFRVMDMHCADEATNLTEAVEGWKKEMLKTMQGLSSRRGVSSVEYAGEDDIDPEPEEKTAGVGDSPCKGELGAKGLSSLPKVCAILGISVDLTSPPDTSLLPRARRAPADASVEVLEGKTCSPNGVAKNCNHQEWTVENPFIASINYAKWLTNSSTEANHLCPSSASHEEWSSRRDVACAEINISRSGIQYQPGDSISVCAPNPTHLVQWTISRIQETIEDNLTADSVIRKCDGEELSLGELLTYRLDLVSIPRKAAVVSLSEYCVEPTEKAAMQWLCAKGEIGKSLWRGFIEDQCLGMGELLSLFPSCRPPLQVLLCALAPLAPRAYSIASSPLTHPCSVLVAFSVVRFCCAVGGYPQNDPSSPVIKRAGLCTSFLQHALSRWLYPSISSNPDSPPGPVLIRVLHKPSICFRLPGSVAPPLILVGPGTGVAPFMGFLSHRAALERERQKSGDDICTGMWRGGYELDGKCDLPCEGNRIDEFIQMVRPGPVHLYFGCRNELDWIFKDEMESRLKDGTLTVLETALSRVGPEKIYVTHKMRERGEEIANLILQRCAYVYICGDGGKMAKDVTRTLMDILSEHGQMSDSDAEKTLECMRSRRRFVLDIWS